MPDLLFPADDGHFFFSFLSAVCESEEKIDAIVFRALTNGSLQNRARWRNAPFLFLFIYWGKRSSACLHIKYCFLIARERSLQVVSLISLGVMKRTAAAGITSAIWWLWKMSSNVRCINGLCDTGWLLFYYTDTKVITCHFCVCVCQMKRQALKSLENVLVSVVCPKKLITYVLKR